MLFINVTLYSSNFHTFKSDLRVPDWRNRKVVYHPEIVSLNLDDTMHVKVTNMALH